MDYEEYEPELDSYLEYYQTTIQFFSKVFDYQYENIVKDLRNKEQENEKFEPTNIGYLKNNNNKLKKYPNFEYGLIEYFYDLNTTNNKLRKEKYTPYQGSATYVEELIMYFSNIYPNVDTTTLLSIGAAESGYYKVQGMLKYNNVYGGMSSGQKLIRYNNIELGVLSYVRLMSRNYYGEGLTTLEAIGKKYCPTKENGVKKASSHWLKLVQNAKKKYKSYNNTITLNEIFKIEEI